MRLIDADALDWERIEHEHGARHEAVVDCEQMVEKAPTIDAVPKTQCLDCQFNGKYGGINLRKINATG